MNIRIFDESDLLDIYGTLSDPDVMKYIEPVYTLDRTRDFLENVALSDFPLIYAAENDDGNYIGYVIYHAYDADSVEIGWLLNKKEWGKGYASKLTELLINKAEHEGKNVVIECDPEQTVTKHIAEKNGFVFDGLRNGCNVYRLAIAHDERINNIISIKK
ncbi:MAG: GNAT family N-acetyltransferase [Lachnospiraceae bacterium]|nr:GNAT family N-acetyltransferase [Lachnospiraceae bacterium]